MRRQSSYKVHLNTICNVELSDPLCDRIKRGLTLVRLSYDKQYNMKYTSCIKFWYNNGCYNMLGGLLETMDMLP